MSETITIKKAYEDGKAAFSTPEVTRKGFNVTAGNPHKSGTFFHKEWERGFNSAYFENLQAGE